jgi:TRAP-type mannitol/chloroaromatic compound transport system permease small subunit
MLLIRKFCGLIDSMNEWIGRAVSWTTLGLVIVIFSDVVMRYVLNISYVFIQELEWHIFSFIFLVGAGYTLLHDGHVRVDIIYQIISPKAQAWVDFIGVLFFLIPGCYIVIKTSGGFCLHSWEVFEGSPDPGGIPYRFIIKSFIPIGFSLMLLQGISLGLKSLLVISGATAGKEKEA